MYMIDGRRPEPGDIVRAERHAGGWLTGRVIANLGPFDDVAPCQDHPGADAYTVHHRDGTHGVYCAPQLTVLLATRPVDVPTRRRRLWPALWPALALVAFLLLLALAGSTPR